MKYCTKCGNSMEDDMVFCEKCGTKFEGIVSTAQSAIGEKLEKMKTYNLVLEAQTISWEYLREDGERAGTIIVKQDKLCQELSDLIKDILETVLAEDRSLVEREVYTYVLQMGYRMCKESEKLFANYSGFNELYETGRSLVQTGQIDAKTFLGQMREQDQVYKVVAGLQGLHSSRIKEMLDENVIHNNAEYISLTKQLAQAFNDMWMKCIKRHTDFFLSPGEPLMNQNWDIYNVILRGLPVAVIDTLDESSWQFVLDDWEKNHNGWQYKQNFIKKRDQERGAKRNQEKEIEDKQYWASHPNECKRWEENRKKITEFRTGVDTLNKEIQILENNKKPFDEKKVNIEANISDKKQRIEKLGKKLFGKKKAEEEIQVINGEVNELNKELQTLYDQIKTIEKPLLDKKFERSNLEREIRRIEQENLELRNK